MNKKHDDIDKLWEEFLKSKNGRAREKLILAYVHLVKYVSGRLAIRLPSYVDIEDLYSAGIIGLMQALDKFDPERNVKFETYAVPRIKGSMLDELRSQDWFPRSIRKKAKVIEEAYSEVESKLGRSATDKEIAEHLHIPLADYYELIDEVCLATLVSLDREITNCNEGLYAVLNEGEHTADSVDPLETLEEKELHKAVRSTLESFPERERMVLTLYYYEELTLKEIGEILKVTESRVCQIHTKAIMRLRGRVRNLTKTLSLQSLASRLARVKAGNIGKTKSA